MRAGGCPGRTRRRSRDRLLRKLGVRGGPTVGAPPTGSDGTDPRSRRCRWAGEVIEEQLSQAIAAAPPAAAARVEFRLAAAAGADIIGGRADAPMGGQGVSQARGAFHADDGAAAGAAGQNHAKRGNRCPGQGGGRGHRLAPPSWSSWPWGSSGVGLPAAVGDVAVVVAGTGPATGGLQVLERGDRGLGGLGEGVVAPAGKLCGVGRAGDLAAGQQVAVAAQDLPGEGQLLAAGVDHPQFHRGDLVGGWPLAVGAHPASPPWGGVGRWTGLPSLARSAAYRAWYSAGWASWSSRCARRPIL